MVTLKLDTFMGLGCISLGLEPCAEHKLQKQYHSMENQRALGLASGSKASEEIKVVQHIPAAAVVALLASLPHKRRK